MRIVPLISVLTILVVAGCGRKESEQTGAAAAAPATNAGFDYTCTDGSKFNARIDRGNVILTVDGQQHTLPPDVNTSGAHYSGDNLTFIAHGKDATFIRVGERVRECQTQ